MASQAAAASQGTAVFNSSPNGAAIEIDGVARGVTPLKLTIAAGAHTVTVTNEGVSRTLPLSVDPGATVSQFVELAVEQPSARGRLEIESEPPGAAVRVDGALRGTAPVSVADLAVGDHKVSVSNGDTTVNRTVNVTAGATATVVVSTNGSAAASAGWVAIVAPFEMEVREGPTLVGTTRADRLMLPVGAHDLTLTNAEFEFAARRTVNVAAGKTSSLSLTLPTGKLSVNASPWADVSVDGRPAGTTPLGNLTVPIGRHEILFQHPQLGERRQTVSIKAQTPTRIGVDLSK
jgi:serine/threonine-protein kinase